MNFFCEKTGKAHNLIIPILGAQVVKNVYSFESCGTEHNKAGRDLLALYMKEHVCGGNVFFDVFENVLDCNDVVEPESQDVASSAIDMKTSLLKSKQVLTYKKFLLDMPEHVFSYFLKSQLDLIEAYLNINDLSDVKADVFLTKISSCYAINLEKILENDDLKRLSSALNSLGIEDVHRAFLTIYIPIAETFLVEPKMFARFLNFFENLALLDPKINSLLLERTIGFAFSETPKHISASVMGSAQLLIDSMSAISCIEFIKRRALFSHTDNFEDLILTAKSYVQGNLRGALKEKETLMLKVFTHLIDLSKQGGGDNARALKKSVQSDGWLKQAQD